jgi:hypothetical protein
MTVQKMLADAQVQWNRLNLLNKEIDNESSEKKSEASVREKIRCQEAEVLESQVSAIALEISTLQSQSANVENILDEDEIDKTTV